MFTKSVTWFNHGPGIDVGVLLGCRYLFNIAQNADDLSFASANRHNNHALTSSVPQVSTALSRAAASWIARHWNCDRGQQRSQYGAIRRWHMWTSYTNISVSGSFCSLVCVDYDNEYSVTLQRCRMRSGLCRTSYMYCTPSILFIYRIRSRRRINSHFRLPATHDTSFLDLNVGYIY